MNGCRPHRRGAAKQSPFLLLPLPFFFILILQGLYPPPLDIPRGSVIVLLGEIFDSGRFSHFASVFLQLSPIFQVFSCIFVIGHNYKINLIISHSAKTHTPNVGVPFLAGSCPANPSPRRMVRRANDKVRRPRARAVLRRELHWHRQPAMPVQPPPGWDWMAVLLSWAKPARQAQ